MGKWLKRGGVAALAFVGIAAIEFGLLAWAAARRGNTSGVVLQGYDQIGYDPYGHR